MKHEAEEAGASLIDLTDDTLGSLEEDLLGTVFGRRLQYLPQKRKDVLPRTDPDRDRDCEKDFYKSGRRGEVRRVDGEQHPC